MASQDDITSQQELLATHRRTLAHYLRQQAIAGDAHVAPSVEFGKREAREHIRRIKYILRGWYVPVENHPDDDDPNQPRRARIFLSYKRDIDPDQHVALQLYHALSLQHDVFIDQAMPIGTRWAEWIRAEIYRTDFLIALLSTYAIHSEMVDVEIATAYRLAQAQNGPPTILPVRLAYNEPFQYPLSEYVNQRNWVVWNGPQDTARVIDAIVRTVAGDATIVVPPVVVVPPAYDALPAPPPAAQPALLELPEGTMDPQSRFYVSRLSDDIAIETIGQQGVTINIKGPRQTGKSSLLIRTIEAARGANKRIAFLDFQQIDRRVLSDADRFFPQFCSWLADVLDIEDRSAESWHSSLGNNQRCTRFVGRYLLKELGAPLVLAMDEVESIFESDFRSDFFGMLRSWHNNRAIMPIWKQLDLVLVTSTEPYQLIDNLNMSPFNVGQEIELVDFTLAQIADLNGRHGSTLTVGEERRLFDLVGGHPYLVRRALYLVAKGRITAAGLFASAADDRGPFGDHLRRQLFRLHARPELTHGLIQVLRSGSCSDETIFWRLRGAGLVRSGQSPVLMRCRLYADYFREHLHA